MKIFIFERISQVARNFHPEGGLVVIAPSREAVRAIIAGDVDIQPTDEEVSEAIELELKNKKVAPGFYVFPDAGCC